jgi:alpha-tubulin suppressor-like RCC1 family protein
VVDEPTLVTSLTSERIIEMTCGDSNVVALSEKGQLYGWGRGFSLENKVDVVSANPKRISAVDRAHCFLIDRIDGSTTKSPARIFSKQDL